REFGGEQLSEEERDGFLQRLLDYLTELFEDANLRPHQEQEPRMELAQDERPNLDIALQRAAMADPVAGLKLLELVEMYWITNDPVGARERIDALLAVAGEELESAVHGRALRFRGATFDMIGRTDLAGPDYVKAIGLLREAGDEEEVTHLTVRLAFGAIEQGELERG